MSKFLLKFAILISPVIPLHLYFQGNWYSVTHSYSLGIFFGIIAYFYMLISLVIAARLRFLDRIIGHDKVLIFHGHIALAGIIAAMLHAAFKWYFSFQFSPHVIAGSISFTIYAAVAFTTMFLMIDSIISRLGFLAEIRKNLLKKRAFDYSYLKLFHNSVSLATILLIFHVYWASSTQETYLRMRFMSVCGAASVLVYIYHKFLKLVILYQRDYRLKGVIRRSDDIYDVTIERSGEKALNFQPGQFVYLRVLSDTCGYEEHPFTISSPPEENNLTITCKALGDYTEKLRNVSSGCKVLVDGPYGVFTPEYPSSDDSPPVIMIAGGIGITPFISVLKNWKSKSGLKSSVSLLYSCRYSRELIETEFFEKYARQDSNFHFVPAVTREKDSRGTLGRIDKTILEKLVSPDQKARTRVYICGSARMRKSMIEMLLETGYSRNQIHFEAFS